MKKRFSSKGLLRRFGVQLPLVFFLAGFSVILVFCGVLYYTVSGLLLGEAISHTQNMLQVNSVNISTYLGSLKAEADFFAKDPALVAYLAGADNTRKAELEQRIQALLQSNPSIQSVVAVSKDGRVLTNEQDLDVSVCENMMMERWYTDALQNDMPVLTGAKMQSCSPNRENWVISVSTEVQTQSGANAGVLRVDMKYEVIENLLQNLNLGMGGYVFILDEAGEPVYHIDPSYFQNPQKTAELVEILQQGAGYDKTSNLLTSKAEVENVGWTMVGIASLDNLQMLRQSLFKTVALTGACLLLLFLGVGLLFTRRLSRPMQRLEKNMQQIEKLAEIAPEGSGFYEMELFSSHYNQMIRRIRKLMAELQTKEESLRHLELHALIAQINPHFLYNTLDTIVWMAEFNDSARVISLTKSLAGFFRLSLSGGRELISLREELEHVQQYLYIQKERYEDKFSYTICWDEEVLPCPVPKIILQPLVENSIYHGIKPLDGKGNIDISARADGEDILLTVQDDGAGFTPGAESQKAPNPKNGVGLQNVQKRVALFYGDTGHFTLESAPGKGCRITIRLSQSGPNTGE